MKPQRTRVGITLFHRPFWQMIFFSFLNLDSFQHLGTQFVIIFSNPDFEKKILHLEEMMSYRHYL